MSVTSKEVSSLIILSKNVDHTLLFQNSYLLLLVNCSHRLRAALPKTHRQAGLIVSKVSIEGGENFRTKKQFVLQSFW